MWKGRTRWLVSEIDLGNLLDSRLYAGALNFAKESDYFLFGL